LESLKSKRDVTKARSMADEIEKEKSSALELAKAALTRDDVTEATHQLGRVRYYSRFIEEVEALEEEAVS
jgi:molecular chaperone HscB